MSQAGRIWIELKEGVKYAWGFVPIRSLLLLLALISFSSGTYAVMLPVYARDVFKGNALTLSVLYFSVGVGAITAALILASRRTVVGLGNWVVGAALAFGVGIAFFGIMPNEYASLPFLALMGFGLMTHMAATNTLVQTILQDHLRGRVMAFYTMAFVGSMPIGSLAAGFASERLGPQWTLIGAGGLAVIGGICFLRVLPKLRPLVHPIYREKGLLGIAEEAQANG